jgi:hypothetical protein
MISLLTYATSPTILANGSLATSDLAAAAFFTLAVGCLWKMFHKLSPTSFVCCWLALAGLFLSKMSAVLIAPMMFVLLVIRLTDNRPLLVRWRRDTTINRRLAQFGVLVGAMLVQAVLVGATIWAFYGFRYSAFHEPRSGKEHFYCDWNPMLAEAGGYGRAVTIARNARLLPEAYLYGLTAVYVLAQHRSAFLNGEYSRTGWWWFFPYTFLVKTPLPTFLILLLAGTGAVWACRRAGRGLRTSLWQGFYATAPLWILLALYWAAAANTKLNIGHRHILSSECFAMYPHYLAYFNCIAGGPEHGYYHLVDSSLDWGQDLPGLQRWLKDHDLNGPAKTPVFLAYFGTASPAYYHIDATPLDGVNRHTIAPLTAGVYCISATTLEQVYSCVPGRWTRNYERAYQETLAACLQLATADPAAQSALIRSKGEAYWNQTLILFDALRMGRLCAFLRKRTPDDNIGHSILIYRLTSGDIQTALCDPPAECVASP